MTRTRTIYLDSPDRPKETEVYTAIPVGERGAVTGRRKVFITLLIVASFGLIAIAVLYLEFLKVVTPAMAILMLVALFGLYFGFGVLIVVYRLVAKLQ